MPNRPLVAILAYDGLCTFEFGCAVEVFGQFRPEMGRDWYRCATVAAEAGALRGLGGVRVEADGGLELLAEAATIVVPGWRGPTAEVPAALAHALAAAHARGVRLVGLCAGAFVLAAAGLLRGRRATTHWAHIGRLAAASPDTELVEDVLYVDEGSVLTSAGSAAGLDLCLHVVRKDFGAKAANRVARRLVLSAHREGGQAQFIDRPVPVRAGTRLGAFLDGVRLRVSEAWTIERMADEAGLSLTGLHRHVRAATGLSPGAWLIAERVRQARELLEETSLSIEAVARATGFGEAVNLRKHFRRAVGLSPRAYRVRFDATAPR
ncbi:transcriptional regulator FtrA [Methylobacterium oryzihabitans]|uniref:Transcriptional regulator FtrA n=1 Tax=Methylobacterium oryzihabitans TaxID=2499852 RepID=A0A437PI13_9HYPH|nr:transcriptional regulator FtrA [Methylobacterium oryzihabitans]RVU21694.1 transcriptional regulator FtrA [Methylobacterium oryzihabitans]